MPGRNAEAVHALRDAHESALPPNVRVIYLWGSQGSGKSHCITAFRDAMHASPLGMAGTDNPVRPLVCDDVDSLDDMGQIELFNAINQRQLHGTGIVLAAGSVAPRDLAVRPELASRLASGWSFQLHGLTDQEKGEALRAHAEARGFSLREEVAQYLLRHARRDMPSLIAMLDALDRYSLETGREITLPLLREVMQPGLVES